MALYYYNASTTTNEMKILQRCGCGWERTTTLRGLPIHMGKKCGGESLKQRCTAQAGQTNGIQGWVENHSAVGPSVGEEEQEKRREEEEEREADDP